jgi:tetratricopeptide (TPR) repeat protein
MPAKRKRSWVFDVLLTVVLLVGAGVGAYFMLTDADGVIALFEKMIGKEPTEEAAEEASPKPIKPDREKKKPVEDVKKADPGPEETTEPISAADPATRTPVSTTAVSAALLDEARSHYRNMAYELALDSLDRLVTGSLSQIDRGEAARLRDRASAFREIVAGIEPLELADAKNIVILHLSNGRKVEGRIFDQKGGFYYLEKNHGIKWPVRSEDVVDVEKVPRSKILKRREAAFRKALQKVTPLTAVRSFELAEHCIREGLNGKVTGLLEQGMALDAQFPVTVYNEKAKRIYRLFLWYKGKKKEKQAKKVLKKLVEGYPKSFYTRKAQEDEKTAPPRAKPPRSPKAPRPPKPAPEEKPEPPPAPPRSPLEGTPEPRPRPPVEPSTPDDELWDRAEATLRKARRHEERSMPGKPNADEENRLAIAAFEKAIGLYERLQKKYPEKAAEIEELLSDMYASLFWCKKRQTLD